MKVKVTRQDIEQGRLEAGWRCGCPIHHALGRALRIPIDPDNEKANALLIWTWHEARLGKIRIPLPQQAVIFQKKLAKDPDAKVKPFEFVTDLQIPS